MVIMTFSIRISVDCHDSTQDMATIRTNRVLDVWKINLTGITHFEGTNAHVGEYSNGVTKISINKY